MCSRLAGEAGVALFAALLDGGMIEPDGGRPVGTGVPYETTEKGDHRLEEIGLDVAALRGTKRRFAGACLDWTERRPHLNGALGAALTTRMIGLGWFERGSERRALIVTEAGRTGLADSFGCVLADR
ncbi:hypothetical protein AB0J52_19845 [Spirillospora sp. NPDC049652]